jgi:hypothetical protein
MLNKVSQHPLTGTTKELALEQLNILYEKKGYKMPKVLAVDTVEAYNECSMSYEQKQDMNTINEILLEKA